MNYGKTIRAPANLRSVRSDIPGGLFELFRWTRSFARDGGADDLVAVVKSVLLHAPETFARRRLSTEDVSHLFDAVLSRRDAPLGFEPTDEDNVLARLLAGNVRTLSLKESSALAERDMFGRIPAFVEAMDLGQAVGVSSGLFLDLADAYPGVPSPDP